MPDDITGARKGDYLILGTLGAGGMGKVYKVRNTLSDRVEAMKVLLPDLSEQQELADRFLREIKVLASLHHPNIAELRTALTISNQLVMIMEYVEGVTLASRLLQGPVRYGDALGYFDQVLAALSCAHAQNIVHRDIKPANIMITPQGMIKLMDFGIARSGNDRGLTMTGTTLGSVAYMSPEQVRCEALDGRSDLYSVGVSLYETVTEQRPYVSDNNFEIMQAHLQVPPTPPIDLKPDIPLALSQLILMAMAKDPEERFQTAEALRVAMQSVATALGEPISAAPYDSPATLELTAPSTRRPTTPSPARPATARPVTARPVTARPMTPRPVTARPVTARPVTAQPAAPPLAPLPAAVAPTPAPRAATTGNGNRRGLYITLSALVALVALAAVGFAVPRWIHARPAEPPARAVTTTPPTAAPNVTVTPSTPNAPAADPTRAANTKPHAAAHSESAATATAPSVTPAPAGVTRNPPQQAAAPPAAHPNSRATEESVRATEDSVAQLAALEHEQLDELSERADKVTIRIAAKQQQPGQHPRNDIIARQQSVQNYLAAAQTALRSADVLSAKKYMDEASAELDKLDKYLAQ
ncbi:MAG: protein kinase [Candidatus Acidiferrales bacterium]